MEIIVVRLLLNVDYVEWGASSVNVSLPFQFIYLSVKEKGEIQILYSSSSPRWLTYE